MNTKITILGNTGGVPGSKNPCSSFLVQSNNVNLLVDCGPGAIAQLCSVITVEQLDAVFISHFHQDHFSDLLCIVHAYAIGAELFGWTPLTVYSPTPTPEIEKLITGPCVNNVYFDRLPGNEMKIEHDDITLEMKKVKHVSTYDSYSVNIYHADDKISFTGDIKEYSDKEIEFFKDADILIADSYMPEEYKDEDSKHITPTEAIRLGEKTNAKKLFLTHFYPIFDFSTYMKEIENARPRVPVYLPKPLESFII